MGHIRSAREAELNAAVRMRELGYPDAEATPIGPDAGIDVVATGAVAQVKRESHAVGRPALQRLFGAAAGADVDLLFFSSSEYSRHAVEYADRVKIALFTYDVLGEICPANDRAAAAELSSEQTRFNAESRRRAQEEKNRRRREVAEAERRDRERRDKQRADELTQSRAAQRQREDEKRAKQKELEAERDVLSMFEQLYFVPATDADGPTHVLSGVAVGIRDGRVPRKSVTAGLVLLWPLLLPLLVLIGRLEDAGWDVSSPGWLAINGVALVLLLAGMPYILFRRFARVAPFRLHEDLCRRYDPRNILDVARNSTSPDIREWACSPQARTFTEDNDTISAQKSTDEE